MTAKIISVPVEWALHGKTPETGSDGYRILSCSDGKLSRRNYEDLHARFTPGTPQTLPQVSLSYLTRADHPDGNYLTLAIHEQAAGGMADHVGREIMFTRYYCVPNQKLRNDAITYTTMFAAFQPIRLQGYNGPTLTVELPVTPPGVPTADRLAHQAAALLLTSPVCVLGAEHTSTDERLAFIDAVMTLLPYGMRARMPATTWTRASQRGHRFRLFFSDAPRGGDATDHQLAWGHPEKTTFPVDDRYARDYYAWLDARVHQPVRRLAGLAEERGFAAKQVVQMLEAIGIESGGLSQDQADGGDNLHAVTVAAEGNKTFGEAALIRCVENMASGNMAGLKNSITEIANYVERRSVDTENRNRCQSIILRYNLLRPGLLDGRQISRFYDALLPLAFGVPLTYQTYCQLEDCLGTGSPPAQPPNPTLLEAIEKAGLADPAVAHLVRWHLGGKARDKWLRQADIAALTDMLVRNRDRPHHAQILCGALMRCLTLLLSDRHYDPGPAWAALRRYGYLAQALQLRHPANPEYQHRALTVFLQACFPGGLTREDVTDVLMHTGSPATPALLAAVLELLRDPDDADLVRYLHFEGLCLFTSFSTATKEVLRQYVIPRGAAPPGMRAIESGRHVGAAPPLPLPTPSMAYTDTVAIPAPGYEEPAPGPDEKHVGKPWRRHLGGYFDLGQND